MKIIELHIPFVCAAELVPVRVVAEGFGFIRIGNQFFWQWRFVRNHIDSIFEVPRGTKINGRMVNPIRVAHTSTAPSAATESPRASTSAPRFASPSIVFDRGPT
jgi:hypothetical protein